LSLADVRFSDRGQALVATVTGEVDLSNAEGIRTAISEAIPNGKQAVILDLSQLDYLDSAGIQLIYQLREDLRARGQDLRLVIPPGSPATDALRLAGVQRHLETSATVDEALRDLG
jgi:stage II sporulation protein AA (anti-sigma F factor antagonist)